MITSYTMPTRAELPVPQPPWQIDRAKAVLLVHDMQRYFLDFFPPGTSPVTELTQNAVMLREAAVAVGVPVVYTAQPGAMTRSERGLLHDIWGAGMSGDPQVRAIVADVAPGERDVVLTKWRYSAFVGSRLEELLEEWQRSQLVVCGVYAHIGCLMTAMDAFSRDVEAFLVADAIADFTAEDHRLTLAWATAQCAATPVTADVLQALQLPSSVPQPG